MDRLRASDYDVRPAPLKVAQRLVREHHYARGGSNTGTYIHGLFRAGEISDDQCLGVAWWIPPTKSAASATFPSDWQGVLALSRLVIVPDVPKNACSFLISRSRKLIDRARWPCLVTYADDWRGHDGGIYRADNWHYVGKTKPERTYVRDGVMVARKAGPKTRRHSEMVDLGCEMVGSFAKSKFIHIAKS